MPESHQSPGAVLSRHQISASDGTPLSVVIAAPPPTVPRASGLPPILAVHGFASNAASGWGRTGHLDALTRAGRMVVALDLRGHGRSGKPHRAEAYGLAQVLDDIRSVASDIDRVTADSGMTGMTKSRARASSMMIDLVGYSLGARLSWTIASRGLLPVRRMVLGGFDGRPLFEGVDEDRLDALAAGVPGNDRVALRYLVEGLAGTGATAADPPAPDVPTLVVAGDQDALAARAAEFAARLPRGEFLSVPGRNHINAVPSQTFRRGVVAFLGR
ncbi:MAG: alpha/beta fold hydrolase [Actinobacteria bacterium]|nr:alpha/beta fold hydrolase [Actinomycetota bacterium]